MRPELFIQGGLLLMEQQRIKLALQKESWEILLFSNTRTKEYRRVRNFLDSQLRMVEKQGVDDIDETVNENQLNMFQKREKEYYGKTNTGRN